MSDEQDRAVAAAERTLGVALHDVIALGDDKRRNLILRAAAPSRSLIIKAARDRNYDAHGADALDTGLVKEWVATAFLSRHAPGNSPVFLGGDAERSLIVLEDLGADLGTLARPLLEGPADAAEQALLAYATSLGRLHADTLGCIDRHADVLRRDFPTATVKPFSVEGWRHAGVDKVAALLGAAPSPDEIAAIARRVAEPGPWRGLAHRDGCPDNVLLSNGRAHLIDFEFAGPGHVLLDATYWRLGFPTCWCAGRVPDGVIAAMDRAYRKALPIAADDEAFRREMAMMLFVRLFASQAWLLERALREDVTWGISTYRPRLLWHLEATIAASEDAGLDGLRATAMRWRDDLVRRWPDTAPLALYPAFR